MLWALANGVGAHRKTLAILLEQEQSKRVRKAEEEAQEARQKAQRLEPHFAMLHETVEKWGGRTACCRGLLGKGTRS